MIHGTHPRIVPRHRPTFERLASFVRTCAHGIDDFFVRGLRVIETDSNDLCIAGF